MIDAIARVLVIAIGYVLACVCGITTLALAAPQTGLFQIPPFSTTLDVLARTMTVLGLVLDAPLATIAALGLAAVVVGEIARLKSWTYHVLAWGAAGGAAAGLSHWLVRAGTPSAVAGEVVLAFLASGFVAGFVYWLIAGRTA